MSERQPQTDTEWMELQDDAGNLFLVPRNQVWKQNIVGDGNGMLAWLSNEATGETLGFIEGEPRSKPDR